MQRRALSTAAFAACVVPVTVYAQNGDDVSQAVVVTASRSEQLLREAIPHTTIITSREIRASGAVDLPSLLRKEAGFEFSQNGGVGTVSSTFLRGATTNQALVLVDGVRLSNLNFGATALEQLMLDQIERVEIVRGNVSSLYGSGAIGGVIQVFTRAGVGAPRASVDLGLGGQGEQRLRAQYGGAVGDTRFSLNLSHFSTDGFSAQKPANSPTTNPDRDGYRNQSLSANLEHRFSADHQAGVRYFSSDGKLSFDNAFAASVNDKHTADARVGSWAVFSNNRIAQWWLSKLTYSEGYDQFDSFTNSTVASRAKTKNSQFTWQNEIPVGTDHRFTITAESLRQSISSDTAYARPGRSVSGLIGAYQGRFGAHSVQFSARNEDYSDFGASRTHYAGYGYDLTERWRFTAASSTAFRAPTFNEMFFPAFGNPNLQPERARSFEAGVQYVAAGQMLRLVAFHTRISDLIGGFPLTNINSATIDGIETSYSGSLWGMDVKASLTMQDPIQHTASTHLQLLRRAKEFGSLSLAKRIGSWRVGGEVLASGRRFDNDIVAFTRVELARYEVFNLTARYQLAKETALSLRLDNAFNKGYTLAHGFNTQGRKLSALLSHGF